MKHGYNLISHNLKAFCLGGIGGLGISVKHILLDVTGGINWDILTLLWVYGVKLLMTAITTAVSGLVTAWVNDLIKNYKASRRSKKGINRNGQSKDKAA